MFFAPSLELMVLAIRHGSPTLQAMVVPHLVQQMDRCEENKAALASERKNLGWYAPALYELRRSDGIVAELLDRVPAWRGSVLPKLDVREQFNGTKPIGILPTEEAKRLYSQTRAQKMAEKEATMAAAAAAAAFPPDPPRAKLPSAPAKPPGTAEPHPPREVGDLGGVDAMVAKIGRPCSPVTSLVKHSVAEDMADGEVDAHAEDDSEDLSLHGSFDP
jgi:hypothetical protein